MSIQFAPIRFASYSLSALLVLGLLFSCDRAEIADPKAELIQSLKGADVKNYLFSFNEEVARTTSALTNRAVENVITLGKTQTGLVLRYARVEDRKNNTKKTYTSEITRMDGSLGLAVTEFGTNTVVFKGSFPTSGPACTYPEQFDSVLACINAFNCNNKGPLLCEANRTCEPQFAALMCCLKNGSAVSVHLIIQPDSITKACLLKDLIPRLEGLVLSAD